MILIGKNQCTRGQNRIAPIKGIYLKTVGVIKAFDIILVKESLAFCTCVKQADTPKRSIVSKIVVEIFKYIEGFISRLVRFSKFLSCFFHSIAVGKEFERGHPPFNPGVSLVTS